jgi:hypothetical protein
MTGAKEQFLNFATSVKTAATAGVTTASAGVGTWFDVIPDDIGKLASLVGLCLTAVLLVFHIKKGLLDIRKANLEIKLLQNKIKD